MAIDDFPREETVTGQALACLFSHPTFSPVLTLGQKKDIPLAKCLNGPDTCLEIYPYEVDIRIPIYVDEKLSLEPEKLAHSYTAAEQQNQDLRPSDGLRARLFPLTAGLLIRCFMASPSQPLWLHLLHSCPPWVPLLLPVTPNYLYALSVSRPLPRLFQIPPLSNTPQSSAQMSCVLEGSPGYLLCRHHHQG